MDQQRMSSRIEALGLDASAFASRIDNTMLDTTISVSEVSEFCRKSAELGFASVAVHSGLIPEAKKAVSGTGTKVCAAISFPLGMLSTICKIAEIRDAIAAGADELDFVSNTNRVKSKDWDYLREEARQIVSACGGRVSKLILETSILTDDEKKMLCDIAAECNVDFIKTSTGFRGGTSYEEIRMLKEHAASRVKVKATGGIRTLHDALSMLEAGAERVGTSSGFAMMEEFESLV